MNTIYWLFKLLIHLDQKEIATHLNVFTVFRLPMHAYMWTKVIFVVKFLIVSQVKELPKTHPEILINM